MLYIDQNGMTTLLNTHAQKLCLIHSDQIHIVFVKHQDVQEESWILYIIPSPGAKRRPKA